MPPASISSLNPVRRQDRISGEPRDPEMAFLERDETGAGPPPEARRGLDGDVLVDLVVLPAQIAGLRGPLSGVPALLVAMLEEAIATLLAGARTRDPRRRAEAARAERWFRSRDVSYAFAFESVCHALDLDAEALRREILRQLAQPATGPARARRRHEVPRGDRRLEYVPAPRRPA
jgi:hypothetical protein